MQLAITNCAPLQSICKIRMYLKRQEAFLCGLHKTFFVFIVWLIFPSYVCHGCHFPKRMNGLWFQKGWPTPISINGSSFSAKGTCIASQRNIFLIEDSKEKCFRCIIIHYKHQNVLQYRETFCDEYSNLEDACKSLTVNAHLHTMFKVDAFPVPCPFKGPFTFNYSRGHGECQHPPSTIDTCTEDSHLLFRFQACADIMGTESSEEELICLAAWKEGPTHYLVGKMKPKKSYTAAHVDETFIRCFVYEKDKDNFYISQSADATCDGLISPRDGSRIMKLRRTKHPTSGCEFPSWVTSTHHWHTLDGRMTYIFSHSRNISRNTTFWIKYSRTAHPDAKVTCTEEVTSTSNSTTIVAYRMQGCSNGFVCLTFHQRDKHIIEIQTGDLTRRPHDACSSPRYDSDGVEYVTLIAPSTSIITLCPQLVATNGLRIAAAKSHIRSDLCHDTSVKIVGCRSDEALEFLTSCDTNQEHMSFQCQGMWEESGRNYLIAGLRGTEAKYCFIYASNPKVTHLSGLQDTCHRTIVPGVTGNIVFNITSAGECDNLLNYSSKAIHSRFLQTTTGIVSLIILLIR